MGLLLCEPEYPTWATEVLSTQFVGRDLNVVALQTYSTFSQQAGAGIMGVAFCEAIAHTSLVPLNLACASVLLDGPSVIPSEWEDFRGVCFFGTTVYAGCKSSGLVRNPSYLFSPMIYYNCGLWHLGWTTLDRSFNKDLPAAVIHVRDILV